MKKLVYIFLFITAFCQGQIINSYAYATETLYEFDENNLILFPEAITGNIPAITTVSATITENYATDPNGGNNAILFTAGNSSARIRQFTDYTTGVGKTFTIKWWVKNIDMQQISYYVDNTFNQNIIPVYNYTNDVNTETWTQLIIENVPGQDTSLRIYFGQIGGYEENSFLIWGFEVIETTP